jgi:hypothetical protein
MLLQRALAYVKISAGVGFCSRYCHFKIARPMLAVGQELVNKEHEVIWCG